MIPMPKNVERAADKGAYKTLRHAAFSIGKSARESMIEEEGPSRPGTPPHVHTGRLRKSILAAVDVKKQEAFIGPSYKLVKRGGRPPWLGKLHEFGGTYKRKKKQKRKSGRDIHGRFIKSTEAAEISITVTYPARPFMQPALQRNLARFHRDWKGAIS